MINETLNVAASSRKQSFLKSPIIVPEQFVVQAVLTSGSGITQIYFNDAILMASALGIVGGSNTQAVTVLAPLTATILREFLKTFAIVFSGYDFDCTNSTELTKNIVLLQTSIDGNSTTKTLFSSTARTNMQYNANLLNISANFVLTNTTAFKMSTAAPAADTTYTFTFYIRDIVPYGNLDLYLEANALIDMTRKVA